MRRTIAAVGAAVLTGGLLAAAGSAASAAPIAPHTSAAVTAAANTALAQHRPDLRASSGDTYTVYSTTVDANGAGHVHYTRGYHGLRVYGGDFVIHTNPTGSYDGSSVGLVAPLTLSTTATVPATSAASTARSHFAGKIDAVGSSELIVDASTGYGRLAWETRVAGTAPDGQTPSRLHVLSDASTGAYIGAWDEIENVAGTGNGIYVGNVALDTTQSGTTFSLVDPVRGNNSACDMNNGSVTCTQFSSTSNAWGNGTNANRQSAAVDAYYGAAKTFDYYLTVHGRNGIFNNGTGVPSRVHYGSAYINAFWDGAQMTYGDGAGNAKPLTSLDVAGHEMSHGVTENSVPGGLTYSGESGGLNEATSDIFGTMVEFYAANATDPGDYLIGEKIDINGNGTPLRWMYNPALDGASDSCWSTGTGGKDVHYSSGVANHFFFNLAEGTGATSWGTSPVCGTAPAVVGVGRSAAEKIWYRALTTYFTSNTAYVSSANPANTARAYTLRAATDLFGSCGTQYKAVQAAWTAVNVAGSDAPCVTGSDFSLSVSPNAGSTNPGGSVSTTVSTAVVTAPAQTVTFSASGLPAGATATFTPASVTAGGSASLTIATATTTPAGSYPVTITGTSANASHATVYTLTVNGPPGCSGTNNTAVPIPDLATVESPININGCAGNASATSTVSVNITHTYSGDLVVSLVAPDNTVSVLQSRLGGATDNIVTTYTVNLSTKAANGTWKLRVQDAAAADVGTINTWSINLVGGGGGGTCTGTNSTPVPIPDLSTINSTIALASCTGNASATSTVAVNITHTWSGDLVVSLVAPDGSVYVLQSRLGGSADNIITTFTVNLSTELRAGTWTLRVQDAAAADVGTLNTWTLTL